MHILSNENNLDFSEIGAEEQEINKDVIVKINGDNDGPVSETKGHDMEIFKLVMIEMDTTISDMDLRTMSKMDFRKWVKNLQDNLHIL